MSAAYVVRDGRTHDRTQAQETETNAVTNAPVCELQQVYLCVCSRLIMILIDTRSSRESSCAASEVHGETGKGVVGAARAPHLRDVEPRRRQQVIRS